jgi:hypothetical protein
VPGIEWAPAWVSWRVGGGYVGWAPLPPRGAVVAAIGVPSPFVFVQTSRFHEKLKPSSVIVNNTTIINKTTVINNVKQETRSLDGISRKVVINEGPGFEAIRKATDRNIRMVPIHEAVRQTSVPPAMAHNLDTREPRQREEVAPDKSRQGPDDVGRSPDRSPRSESPPSGSLRQSRGRGEGKGHGRDK